VARLEAADLDRGLCHEVGVGFGGGAVEGVDLLAEELAAVGSVGLGELVCGEVGREEGAGDGGGGAVARPLLRRVGGGLLMMPPHAGARGVAPARRTSSPRFVLGAIAPAGEWGSSG
jgi:hypothetical protein